MKKLPIEIVENRRKFVLFKNDCGVSDVARGGGVYESWMFDYLNGIDVCGKTIIDVGANFGHHAMEFADLVGSYGTVYAYEAQRLTYYQLCANILLNGYTNIRAEHLAIGEKIDYTTVETPDFLSDQTINVGNTHVHSSSLSSEIVPMQPLDNLVHRAPIAVLKIDVEGYEPRVLDGATNLITTHRPIIFIEVWDVNLGVFGFSEKDVFSRLDALGYKWEKLIKADHIIDYVATPR